VLQWSGLEWGRIATPSSTCTSRPPHLHGAVPLPAGQAPPLIVMHQSSEIAHVLMYCRCQIMRTHTARSRREFFGVGVRSRFHPACFWWWGTCTCCYLFVLKLQVDRRWWLLLLFGKHMHQYLNVRGARPRNGLLLVCWEVLSGGRSMPKNL
jgi:hypothetical protein